jgi:hypothetical protein
MGGGVKNVLVKNKEQLIQGYPGNVVTFLIIDQPKVMRSTSSIPIAGICQH